MSGCGILVFAFMPLLTPFPSQMLVVEEPIPNEDTLRNQALNVDEFIWPHGITPPLHHVRKRRFRKRINRRVRESLRKPRMNAHSCADHRDCRAGGREAPRGRRACRRSQIRYEFSLRCSLPIFSSRACADVLENVNPDLSDSEYIDREDTMDPTTPGGFGGSEAGDMPTPGADHGDGDGERDEGAEDDAEEEGDIDEDLAAELDLALGDDDEGEGDDEDEDDDESESDEDDEDDEAVQAKKLLNEEIRDLEAAVTKKNHEIASSANPLIRVRALFPACLIHYGSHCYPPQRRFEDALRKLQADLDTKLVQRDEMKEMRRLQQEGGGTTGASEGGDGDDADSDDGDLFGDPGPSANMDIG